MTFFSSDDGPLGSYQVSPDKEFLLVLSNHTNVQVSGVANQSLNNPLFSLTITEKSVIDKQYWAVWELLNLYKKVESVHWPEKPKIKFTSENRWGTRYGTCSLEKFVPLANVEYSIGFWAKVRSVVRLAEYRIKRKDVKYLELKLIGIFF